MFRRAFSPLIWRQRLIVWLCAILTGLIAAGFSKMADRAQESFFSIVHMNMLLPLIVTPSVFFVTAFMTDRWFPSIPGSGIPQAIAARELHNRKARQWLLGFRVIFGKIFVTSLCMLSGASIGREGPTVQVGAALLMLCAKFKVLNTDRSLILAGSAAGVAAAFNTPIAGIVFAIEEMAQGFHRRNSTLVLMAIVLSGMASMSILGNYNYFGLVVTQFSLTSDWGPLCVIGIICGLFGALFIWLLTHGISYLRQRAGQHLPQHPAAFAALCGLAVAVLGLLTHGDTYGTGYTLANQLLRGLHTVSWGTALAKLGATVLSGICSIPGGIFSPSLSIGAALGSSMLPWFHHTPAQIVIVLAMAAYLSGVTQAPITSAIIVLEITGKTVMPAPLIAIAVLASMISRVFCPLSLYHALAMRYIVRAMEATKQPEPQSSSPSPPVPTQSA